MSILFENVTSSSGIEWNGELGSISVNWLDFNADGLLDLWLVPHGFNSGIVARQPKLYLNQGDGTFSEIAETVFAENFFGDNHGAVWIDFDNDGDSDLFITNGGAGGTGEGPNKLFVNQASILRDRAIELNIDFGLGRGRTSLWFDSDRDGLLDVVQINKARPDGQAPSTFWQQTANGFVNANEIVGFDVTDSAVTAQIADLFGNGTQDLLVFADDSSPVKVYETTTSNWNDLTASLPQISQVRDVAIADFNNDGVQDIFLTRVNEPIAQAVNSNFAVAQKTAFARLITTQEVPEVGISWQTNGTIFFDNSTSWTLDKPTGSEVPSSQIFLGSQGINPSTSNFTLSASDPRVEGIFSLTDESAPGLYIGYNSTTQTWEAVSFKTSYGSSNLLIESTEPLIDVTPVGFAQPELAGLGGLPPVLLVYDPETEAYVEQTEIAGLEAPTSSRSVVSGDFDNDGDVDLYLESSTVYYSLPSILYDNQGDGTFVPVTDAGGAQIEFLGPRHEDFNIGINLATGDYNRDGFLDIFAGASTVESNDGSEALGTPYSLFRNQGNDNNWLQIDLQGVQTNRDGIGTKVFATTTELTQLRENSGGTHRIGQNQPWLHFGLGENEQVDLLRVEWLSGVIQEFTNINTNQLLEIFEDRGSDRSDLLIGTSQDETFYGLNGNDTLEGEAGNDLLIGGNGNDLLQGNDNRDILRGGSGRDTLNGGNGNDRLLGNGNRDTLGGGNGRDTLRGGAGDDLLQGDGGSDLFVIAEDEGTDRILDFQLGEDRIALAKELTFAELTFSQNEILSATDTLMRLNISAESLTESDFIEI